MKIKTSKGAFNGTVSQCAQWLEMMQPAFVRVVVELDHDAAESDVVTPLGMECGWENTRELRAAIRTAWVEASVECAGHPAA
jgi:hypothetical protein